MPDEVMLMHEGAALLLSMTIFEITERENPGRWFGISAGAPQMAVLDFRHSGWDEESEYFGFCNSAWAETLRMLKQWCESP